MGDSEKVIAENYTKTYTTLINNKVEGVLYRDPDAIHVILLNYHNTLTSSHGLSYRYLTSITEKRKAQAHKSCFRIFKELDYLNYGQEIQRINELKYLRIDSISKYEHEYPNFMELLKICGTPSAAFYPIHGTHDYIGMLIVLYNKPKDYQLGYYQRVLHEPLQDLAILLDYNSVKNEYIKKYLETMR